MNLIELSLVGDREVVAQAAGRLEAEDGRQLSAVWRRPMQIGDLRRPHREAAVVDRQIALQESVRRLEARNPCEAQLLDQSILKRLKPK